MNLEKYICDLLYRHECVIVPDFGAFITNYEAASIQSTTHTILPPRKYLVFNSALTINDGLLATEISSDLKCSFEEAMQLIRRDVTAWQERLKAGKTIMLPGIGTFSLNREGKTEFRPDQDQNFFGETFGMNALVIPPLQKRHIKPKDAFRNRRITTKHSGRTLRRLAMAAAITIPLVAAGIWSFMNYDSLKHYAMQHSGIVKVFSPLSESKPVAIHEKNVGEVLNPEVFENPETGLNPGSFEEINPESDTQEIANDMQQDEAMLAEAVTPVASAPAIVTSRAYHIIVGSFESLDNARHLADELHASGWNAQVISSDQGMHRVSIISVYHKQEALQKLENIRQETNPGAWLLRI